MQGKEPSSGDLSPSSPGSATPSAASGEIGDYYDIQRLVSALLKGKFIVIGFLVSGMLLGIGAHFLIKPTYRTEIVLRLAEDESGNDPTGGISGQFGGVAAILGLSVPGGANLFASLAYLQSREYAITFVESNDLESTLFSDRWDPQLGRWRADEGPPTKMEISRRFFEYYSVALDQETGLITLSFDWFEPEESARLARLFVGQVNDTLRAKTLSDSDKRLEYLNSQLDQVHAVELREALYRLTEVEMKRTMVANVSPEYAFEIIDPAVPPDKPRLGRVLLGAIGLILGGIAGVLAAIARYGRDA